MVSARGLSFKPQRGKFTRLSVFGAAKDASVSNPNGVNLHYEHQQRAFYKLSVSNPNGVNLHRYQIPHSDLTLQFQTPTG